MRQKRAKSYKKQMNVYIHSFKFREPFQTIVDDELVLTCHKNSFDLTKGLARTIQGEVKPMITQCCMQALYQTNNQPAIDSAKLLERRRCNHPPSDPLPPAECIESITSIDGENKHRYVIATQHHSLRKALRKVPGIPIVHMNRSVMVMEPISKASLRYSNLLEAKKLTGGLNDFESAGIKKQDGDDSDDDKDDNDDEKPQPKKRKGPKGPNPLSVKKKKKDTVPNQHSQDHQSTSKPKRRRKHSKNPHQDNDGNSNNDHDLDNENNLE